MKTLREYIDLVKQGLEERVSFDAQTGKMTPSFADQMRQQSSEPPKEPQTNQPMKGSDLPRATAVDREQETVTVDGKIMKYVLVKPGGPRPRTQEQIAIPRALMGIRGLGNYIGLVANNTVYILPEKEQ